MAAWAQRWADDDDDNGNDGPSISFARNSAQGRGRGSAAGSMRSSGAGGVRADSSHKRQRGPVTQDDDDDEGGDDGSTRGWRGYQGAAPAQRQPQQQHQQQQQRRERGGTAATHDDSGDDDGPTYSSSRSERVDFIALGTPLELPKVDPFGDDNSAKRKAPWQMEVGAGRRKRGTAPASSQSLN